MRSEVEAEETNSKYAPIVHLQDVDVAFGDRLAVRNLSLSILSGERVAIVGATGAGKSTVLALIAGSLEPTKGTVSVCGVAPSQAGRKLQGRVAIAFQSPRLLPWRTAMQNVGLGLQIMKVPRAEIRERSERWLDRVGLHDESAKYPYQLSGGMKQRVSLARALVVEPDLLLLDEAFSALDERTAKDIRRDFDALIRETGVTSVLVTHRIEEAFAMSSRVMVFGVPAQLVKEFENDKIDFDDPLTVDAARIDIFQYLGGDTPAEGLR